ncbi:bromodomain adjacent to zinc finger domain protein 1A [Culicoides brevitarsis]|uniref:bromodomain adjacent to zinc finger domain protein 1A n=1 Tax=Culicoides brevitarsis TaxID=469753 RepID=UPI00307C907B
MPLLKRKSFVRAKSPESLRDDEEVFYCEQTKEIFRNYEDYFERVMLISSMVWTCAYTGKPNLTYDEAVESEKAARTILRRFPNAIRGPVIMVASQTKRSNISELVDDVFNFVKDRFYVGERVDVLHGNKYRCCKITEVLKPANSNSASPVKADKIRYKVFALDDKQPNEWVAVPENIKRDKIVFSKEKSKLFLKQNIEVVNNMIKIKDDSFKKYVTDRDIKFEDIFIGKAPDFELSKQLVKIAEKEAKRKLDIENGTSKPKKKSENSTTTKMNKKKGQKNDKSQTSIDKYLNKSDSSASKPKMSAKEREEAQLKLKEEMERRKKEQEARDAERKKRLEEEKAELNAEVSSAIKDFNQLRDDLELQDQRPLPKPKKITSLIGDKQFGDFVQILEFLHTFSEILSMHDKFPQGVTMPVLERALILREPNGPLSDILQVLLSSVFSLQIEEANEIAIQYDPNAELSQRRNDVEKLREASRVGLWCVKHYSTHLNELVMDGTTLSELLRLHFLSSGGLINGQGSNWRYQQRGGYLSHDDPGYLFCQTNPHIIKTLGVNTVYNLTQNDIIKIIKCLMDQILSYSSVRDLLEERLEKAAKARYNYKVLCISEKKREAQVQSEKNKMKDELKKILQDFKGTQAEKEELKKKKEAENATKCEQLDAQSEREKTKFIRESQKLKEEFFNYQVFLGCDRAGRNYWLFESVSGLFVEHDMTFAGNCQEKSTVNLPGLANCPADQRNKFIKQMIIDRKSSNSNDKENKVENGMRQPTMNGIIKGSDNKDETENDQIESKSTGELMMCTADPNNCPVHTIDYPGHIQWGYFNTAKELDELIAGLNPRGYKEKVLRDNLEVERDLIVNHIQWCPIDKLTVTEDKFETTLKLAVENSARKYANPNWQFDSDTDVNLMMEVKLREDLLDFEFKLKSGYLGDIKVKDRDAWRTALENFQYDQQSDALQWGPDKKLYEGKAKLNGHDTPNEKNEEKNDTQNEDETSKLKEDDDEQLEASFGHIENDPGYNLSENLVIESESENDGTSMHTSKTLKDKVHSLAKALLQIEQGIDQKFIRMPFGPKRDFKDKDIMARKNAERRRKLERWEESLMRSTTYSQVYLHYNILYDAVTWSRSAAKTNCVVCRRAKDPEYTLLCDDCNKGYHTYCLKPKVKTIPEGNWYCPKCHPEDFIVKRGSKRKIFEAEEEEVEDTEETTQDEDTLDETIDESVVDDDNDSDYGRPSRRSRAKKEKKKPKITDIFRGRQKEEDDNSRRSSIADDSIFEKPSRRPKKSVAANSTMDESDSDTTDDIPLMSIKKRSTRSRGGNTETSPRKRNSRHLTVDSDDDEPLSRTRAKRKRHSSDEQTSPTTSNRRSVRRNGDNDDENLVLHAPILYTLLDQISKHSCSWPFNRPVTLKEVPDYHEIIKNPMDFAKIKSRLNMGHYKTDYDVMNDIQLVFSNCDLYNGSGSEIYSAGIELENFVNKKCKEYKLPFRPSDMTANTSTSEPPNDEGNSKQNRKKRTL